MTSERLWRVALCICASGAWTANARAHAPVNVETDAPGSSTRSRNQQREQQPQRWRVALGGSAGWAYGGHASARVAVARWRFGSLQVGGLLGAHGYPLVGRRSGVAEVTGIDLSTRLGPSIGHDFGFFRDRLHLTTDVYTAASWRHHRARLVDTVHDVAATTRYDRLAWEHGCALSIGVRVRGSWSIHLDGVAPLFWSGADGMRRAWRWASPFAGISVGYGR